MTSGIITVFKISLPTFSTGVEIRGSMIKKKHLQKMSASA